MQLFLLVCYRSSSKQLHRLGAPSMSKPSPLSRSSSRESIVESSSHETPIAKEQTDSPPSPVMKTKTKKDDQQEAYKASESTNTIANANESSSSSAIVTKKNDGDEKNFKTEIDTAQKLSAEKEQWEKFSKKINRFGVLKLENLNSEAIQNLAE